MRVISGLKELEILVHNSFVWLVETLAAKKLVPCDTFFGNHEPNCVPETSHSYLQYIPIYYPSGKYKLSIRFFLEYYYRVG